MDLPSGTPTPSPGRLPRLAVAAGLVVVLSGVVGVLAWRGTFSGNDPAAVRGAPPPDPRLSYAGPLLNVNPRVGYVGDAACAGCHPDETRSYRRHPMGRSLAPIGEVIGRPPHDRRGEVFTALASRFSIERRGDEVWHRQTRLDESGAPVYELDLPVRYVIGSGTRGYSYLAERDGYLFQTPISWYSQKRLWDLSPQFNPALLPGRPITPECLFCHANRTRPREDTRNGYLPPVFEGHAIGCERCHGPGGLHAQGPGRPDSIVRLGRLEPALRDAVCEQCHLSGEVRVLRRGRGLYDFRPGLPLHLFWSVFVKDPRGGSGPAGQKAVGHVEGMHLSKCYQRSRGERRLSCITCHNPHDDVPPDRRVDYYRRRCLGCHQCRLERPARLRQSKEDSCIQCHMPPYPAADIAHTAATDHRIRRPSRGVEARGPTAEGEGLGLTAWQSPAGPGDRELDRDLGVGLARLAGSGAPDRQRLARRAVDLLGGSLSTFPDDVDAREARGQALNLLGRRPEALAAFEEALARSPRREVSLQGAAALAQDSNLRDKALAYWRRAVEVDPWAAESRGNLALLLAHAGAWDEAREQCRAWLRLDPGSLNARTLWLRCLRQQGDRAGARAEADTIRRLR